MAFHASIAAINAEDHDRDTTETRTKLAVLANISDDEDEIELRSVPSYQSQKSPLSSSRTHSIIELPKEQPELPQQQLSQRSTSQSSKSLSHINQIEPPTNQIEEETKPPEQIPEDIPYTVKSVIGTTLSKDDKTVSFATELPEYIPPSEGSQSLRHKIFVLLDSPKSSRLAFAISLTLLGVVLLSTCAFLIGSLPEFWVDPPKELFVIEAFCVSAFLVEYLAKLFTSPNWKKWIVSPLSIIDFLAIVPFFLEFIITSNLGSIAVIRVIRLVRIFRIFKLGKFSVTMTIVGRTIVRAREGIMLLVFLVMLSLLIFSSAIFYAEQSTQKFDEDSKKWMRDDGTESPFQSIPATFWWCAVTLTTTGYGDQFPVSWPGRAVAMVTMLCGILVIAFPVTIINTHFQDTWQEIKSAQRQKKEESKYTRKGVQTLDRTVKLLLKRNYLMLEQMAEMNLQLQRYQYEIAQMNKMLENIHTQIPRGQIGILISSSPTITDNDSVSFSTVS